ncbi:mannitol-1-phosphate 5-dehydrogenase [Bacillus sp. FJAT-42376]|uniref:mannitol-1-phosphate 5-dehydrogenase n=1 Tax=Bacillus sp. FJAT-42376 TaxID=2014076 RepID=UPI000F4EFE85|nr:mannitol-1-phosphate 5-dehydrogenase [Bacillus sp. FJAT-42376]AZB41316.1 mannitol-1-phosphate 5-dehydrogenase [Bacillus sp. FJAT-42376]
MKSTIHFGAGNIGRGFIGALFSQSGYHVTFVDIADEIINKLNEEKSYKVKTAADPQEVMEIANVSGLNNMKQEQEVIEAIGQAEYVTTAIGPNILPRIAPLIAKGIEKRLGENDAPLYIIACENQIGATDILKGHILEQLDGETKAKLEGRVFFFNSAVDRIVPIQNNQGSLDVLVETYYEWVVETNQEIPHVEGMMTVPDLAPFIERKLFTVNTGHAVTAYFGWLAGKETIDEALNDETISEQVKNTLKETGAYLVKTYGLDQGEHDKYIGKIIGRFQNPYLHDGVSRVGRSPLRKLGPEDRLVKPARESNRLGLPTENLAKAIAAALLFDVKDDSESVELQKMVSEHGIVHVLTEVSKLDRESSLVKEIAAQYEQLKK